MLSKDQALDSKRTAINSNLTIVLHTKIGQSLFLGSWRPGKLGLRQFATIVLNLWQAVKADDPYAEWFLLRIYQAIHEARDNIKTIELLLEKKFDALRGITVDESTSDAQVSYPLHFATPFGFMGAYLIADVDFVLRRLLVLQKIGVPVIEEDISIKNIIKIVQDVFALPRGWSQTGIVREDLLEHNDKAVKAIELMGKLPEVVLKGEIDFSFLPKNGRLK